LPKHVLGFQHPATLKRAGLKFRIYDCRHSFATRQAEKGVNLLTLAAMLGHFGLNQVQRHAHPSEDQKRDAMQQKQNGKAKAV
jgi:site-specific recombinase XerD